MVGLRQDFQLFPDLLGIAVNAEQAILADKGQFVRLIWVIQRLFNRRYSLCPVGYGIKAAQVTAGGDTLRLLLGFGAEHLHPDVNLGFGQAF